MGKTRIDLQKTLEKLLGSKNVYFQPPETLKLCYDCIVYRKSDRSLRHADNRVYSNTTCYQLVYIYRDPDSCITDKLIDYFPMIDFDRHYTANNLNHDVLTLYF